jgi:hypothetical protein
MTENTTRTATDRTMNDVSHTHPDTDRPFGEKVVFERGPAVAADGGKRDVVGDDDHDTDEEQMKDVDHEPPNEAETNRVFERGREGRDEVR